MKKFVRTLRENFIFLFNGLTWCSVVNLILLYSGFGNIVAFKDYHITGEGFIDSVMKSKWVGFDNFKFLFSSKDAYIITRNTVLYNLGFIFLGLIVSVGIAIIFSELRSKEWSRCFKPPCSSHTSYHGLSSASSPMPSLTWTKDWSTHS